MDETEIVLCPDVQLSSSFGFVLVSANCSELKRMATKFQTFLPTETWSSPTWSCCLENNLRINLKVKKSCLINPEDVLKRHPNFQDRTRGFCYWITLAEAVLGKRLDVTDENNMLELAHFLNMTLPELLGPAVLDMVREGYTVTYLLAQIVDHLMSGEILPEECWGGDFFTDCIPIIDGLKLVYWNANNDESEFMRIHTLASVRTINETFSNANNRRTANIFYNGHGFATGYVNNVLLHEQVAIATRSLIEIMKKFVL